ncbi:RICIN domain-containing protein [Planotetraspora sp. A-T 1434]|uniref:LamG-like jellyroll fold domain-containing protein n=1 Tax=Planotetraspora sp. A-T 1434 TaxID=2979219 RepID=UPI0021C02FEF|nr:LamG-like jellyroll fold domain-containing protein [Planotetraspora sp. A-T 1434]MCT9929855.1 RICIN domain-containing protein [Planotetraspora sp. A-T 1434]
MTHDKNLVKVYGDRDYIATTMVRHDGIVVAFAVGADRRIYYSVLSLDQADRRRGALDAAYWNNDPGVLPFPAEIVDTEAESPVAVAMPTVKKVGGAEVGPAETLLTGEKDPFLSTTARLTAALPIQVLSDGQYILVFRQSVTSGEPGSVYATTGGALSGDPARADYVLTGGAKVAQVDGSLLCDRFVLVGSELKPVVEVRYQRSRSRTMPASGGDTLGTRDMEGQLFYEPTMKLSFVRKLSGGLFSVLLLPTAVAGFSRWQIFAAEGETIHSYNLEQGTDGLFNARGTQLYTSPDPKYAGSVLERAPGIDSHTGKALVPVPAPRDRAGTALRFEGAKSGVVIAGGKSSTAVPPGPYTIEAWIKPTVAAKSIIVGRSDKTNFATPVYLGLNVDGKLVFGHGPDTLISASALPLNVFTHVAAVYDKSTMRLFVNGTQTDSRPTNVGVQVSELLVIGKRLVSGMAPNDPFTGDIDEIRIWSVARTDFTARGQRLTGKETGLFAYFPFDEGAGKKLSDRGPNGFTGSLGPSPVWVSSDAPLYDGPGVVRTSFSINGRKPASGLATEFYFQQEPTVTGYSTSPAPEKRQGRVLLAFATSGPPPQGEPADRRYVATVDFAVSQYGRLATPPGVIDLTWLGRPDPTADLEKLQAAEAAVTAARGRYYTDQALVDQMPATDKRINDIQGEVYGGLAGFTFHDLNQNFYHLRYWQRMREQELLEEQELLKAQLSEQMKALQRLPGDKAALEAAQNTLATLSGAQKGGAEAVLPMPAVCVDRSGLNVLGALLAFAWTADAPFLLDGSTGEVVLYFRGGAGQFFSAYYPAAVSPAVKQLPVADGAVRLTSRDSSVGLNGFSVAVSAAGSGTCTVTVTRGAVTETFTGVPQRADLLAAVLNGPVQGSDLGTIASVKDATVTLTEPLTTALPTGSAITVGGENRTVSASQAGSAQLTLTAGGLTAKPGARVRKAVYDYTQASCNVPGVSVATGSQIVGANAGSATGTVSNGTAADVSGPLVPRWQGDAPGRAFSFDGTAKHRLELADTARLAKLAARGDLAIEAWAFPTFVNGPVRILNSDLGNGVRYSLGLDKAELAAGKSGYVLVAGVGDQVVRGTEAFPLAEWGHVAVSFEQSWAIAMDGSGHVDAGGSGGLDIVEDLTLEAFVKLEALGTVQGLVGKGAIGAGTSQAVPYSLYLEADGQVAFAFESGSGGAGKQQIYRSGAGSVVKPGEFTKIAVTRRNPSSGSGSVEICFYINGKLAGNSHEYGGAKPVGNDAPVQLGRHQVGKETFGLRGVLSEVRIWSLARNAKQIGAPITEKASGLVAWWIFPESEGTQTADRCGSYPATLHAVSRVRTPDPEGNRFTLYRNGVPTSYKRITAVSDPLMDARNSPAHSAVAGRKLASGYGEAFTGDLDEIRVWRTARTQEQVLDNMFGRVRGDRQDLIAYYPFDVEDTVAGAQVRDAGLGGNHLTQSAPAPKIVLSSAPISTDTAQVRSALTGLRSPFHAAIAGTPAATEYGDVQQTVEGMTIGVMKRAYTYLKDKAWVLITGYKIGELTTTWVGQAQFDPQLIGYIEGAPPVPSENLVGGGSDYRGASSVAFVQADNVVNVLSSQKNNTVDTSLKTTIDASTKEETYVITAPLGVGTAKPLKVSFDVGYSAEFKFSNSWTNEKKVSQGTNTTRTSRVDLTGGWEDADAARQVNPAAGRRWVPANTGFAVVQSETADLYALRLAHSGALVAYRMLPSADIPRDWNLIPFPINPRYTKQGTLDGVVGYSKDQQPFADPDFPRAAGGTRGEHSYFRPLEAYRIKKRIQREQQQLQGFYDSVSTETHAPDPTHGQATKVLNGMMGGTGAEIDSGTDPEAARSAARSASRRNIVNTYVWTAAGGFFAETTGTTDQVTDTITGSYSFNATIGRSVAMKVDFGPVSAKFGLEASLGTGYSVTRTKSKESTRTFSLDVTCAPSGQLQRFNGDTPMFDKDGKPALVPGRVDAYRFMTFYLDTTTDNFEDFYGKVIDPEWLESSTEPNALALKRARQSDRKPPCWRILHRVTFVSRVLATTPAAQPSLQQAMAAQKIASPYALIKQLEPYLGTAVLSADGLPGKVKAVVTGYFPAFSPYINEITALLADYYSAIEPAAPTAPALVVAPARACLVAGDSGNVIDVGWSSQDNGAQLLLWPWSGTSNQKWTLASVGDGYYSVTAKHSGKVLTVTGAGKTAGTAVCQSEWTGADHQRFRLQSAGNGFYGLIAKHSGMAVTVAGGQLVSGAGIQTQEWTGADHQLWQLRPLSADQW